MSCCQICSLQDHKSHLLIPKEKHILKQIQINNSFKSIEDFLAQNELFKNIQQRKQENIIEIQNTFKKIESLVNLMKGKTKSLRKLVIYLMKLF